MRLFGTNGVRGKVPLEINPAFGHKLAMAIAMCFEDREFLIGGDTRKSTPAIKEAVISALLASGKDVVDLGVLPTPALQHACMVRRRPGVMITASHNPPEFNGIKVIASDGTELMRGDEERIEKAFYSEKYWYVSWERFGEVTRTDYTEEYVKSVVSRVNASLISGAGISVIADLANGAAWRTTPAILRRLGVAQKTINSHPDGLFPGRPSEPKRENLALLMALVREEGADLGIAHDGDADRVIFVDERGEYISGDKILALFAREIVKKKGGGKVVTPVSTSLAVEEVVREEGGEVVYTRVGAPIVARTMREVGAVFGGEENGGYIFPEHQYCRDGGMAVAALLEILAESGESLSSLVASLPRYSQCKRSVECPNAAKERVMDAIASAIDLPKETMDGVKARISPRSWVLIRPSGTEPIIRVYAEGTTEEEARRIADEYARLAEEIVDEVLRHNPEG